MTKSEQSKSPKTGIAVGRDARTGTFVVAKPAVSSQSLKPRDISDAVRKVNLSQQATKKK